MKKIKFTILPNGYMENDLALNVAYPHLGTLDNKNPEAEWVRVPSFSVLIDHPEQGYILYDASFCPGDEKDRRPESDRNLLPVYCEKDEFVDARLAQLGLSPKDISILILSHMHFDHCGGLTFFSGTVAGQNVYVGKDDFEFGLIETHRSSTEKSLGYLKGNFEFPDLTFNLVEENMTVAPGVDLILLEGHSPSVLGLVIHLSSGVYIFPSDTIYMKENYGPPIRQPGYIYDTLGFMRSVKKIRKLEKELHATIIYSHDPGQFKSLKTMSEYYE